MAVPRPVLLALVGLALIASAFLLTRRGSTESVSTPQAPAASASVAYCRISVGLSVVSRDRMIRLSVPDV